MYHYDDYDQTVVNERAAQFRGQTERFLKGELSEDEFRPLRLQNGLYIQRHAPMLRIAVPYGLMSSEQMRCIARISRDYDKSYAHMTTRQNVQLNWPALENVPQILADLAQVQMHAIQTSGNCIRNITSDPFAGIAQDEIVDPRPYCEILRQWSTFHPEFAHLPRKFKVAVNGARQDRAAVAVHDIGLHLYHNPVGEVAVRVLVGGGLGRTPVIGTVIHDNLPWQHLLTYIEAIMRVYNRYGRRDNMYKARIKILVRALGAEKFAEEVHAEWAHLKEGAATLTQEELQRVAAHFTDPAYTALAVEDEADLATHIASLKAQYPAFARWNQRNVCAHKKAGYVAVTLSLKRSSIAPGDASADEMDAIAQLADEYSFSELRITHEQNIVLSDVPQSRLFELWERAKTLGFATPNIGLVTDIIACPGGDFCSLANAKSIPIALEIQERLDNIDYVFDLGELSLNISGCINSCGHHHIGNIGILGVDKNGSEWYQITLGGRQGVAAEIGKVIGRSFTANEVPSVIEKILATYVGVRSEDELFIDTFDRVGVEPFKIAVYGAQGEAA